MFVMGLDTALQRCSVAILRDGEGVVDKFADMERGHAERLAPMAAEALAEAGIKVTDLDRVGVVIGPGGFTGVRVALAFARGLAIGTDIGVAGITSLEALSRNVTDLATDVLIAAIIDARRGEVYAGLYAQGGAVLVEPFVAAPEQTLKLLVEKAGGQPVVVVGSGSRLLPAPPSGWAVSPAPNQIDSKIVARLAAAAPAPAGPPAPLYLRSPDAKPPKPGLFDEISKR